MGLTLDIEEFINRYNNLKDKNNVNKNMRLSLEKQIDALTLSTKELEDDLALLTKATTLLTSLKDESLFKTYKFIESSINNALSQIYTNNSRQIRLVESVHSDTYPHLDFELVVGNNVIDLSDSGHGISQIISLISTMCLIVLKGERRLLCLDEVLSGIDYKGMSVVNIILNSFSDLGFQFIIVEHNFVPSNATVYELGLVDGVCKVLDCWDSGEECYAGFKRGLTNS